MKKALLTTVLVLVTLVFGFFAISGQFTLHRAEYKVAEAETEETTDNEVSPASLELGDEAEYCTCEEPVDAEGDGTCDICEKPIKVSESEEAEYCECLEGFTDVKNNDTEAEEPDGKCDVCGKAAKPVEDEPTEHEHSYTEVEAKEPTCTEAGYNAYQVCECGDKQGYEELPALGHEAGEDGYCIRCGYKDVAYTLPATVLGIIGLGNFYTAHKIYADVLFMTLFALFAFLTGLVLGHKFKKKDKAPKAPKQKKVKNTRKHEKRVEKAAAPAEAPQQAPRGPRVRF